MAEASFWAYPTWNPPVIDTDVSHRLTRIERKLEDLERMIRQLAEQQGVELDG